MADVVRELRIEFNETGNGSSISTAIQNMSASSHIGQANSNTSWQTLIRGCRRGPIKGERVLVRVDSIDRTDSYTLGVDCSQEEFITIVVTLSRTTSNEPLGTECGKQSKSEFQENHPGERQVGEHQSHNGLELQDML